MKICAIIAEYNPFHLGHLKQIEYVKNVLKADKTVIVLSGNFTQRGEPAVQNKYQRAKWAIDAGADLVVELPTVFAVNNAETFAKGAIKIIDGLGFITHLCFGVESGDKESYLGTALSLMNESKEFKRALKKELETGVSLVKARFNALKNLNVENLNDDLIATPNNILGLEYTKALLSLNSPIEIVPMIRNGDHNDKKLYKGITSATSIRETFKAFGKGKIKSNLPNFVYKSLTKKAYDFDDVIMSALISAPAEKIALSPDCTEGLENRIKALIKENKDFSSAVNKITTKRYTSSRIRRIMISNLLGITKDAVKNALSDKLYAKVLAVKKESLSLLGEASEKIVVLTRKNDYAKLKDTAQKIFNVDVTANEIYNLVSKGNNSETHVVLVD